jgi:hypothetical protein
MLVCFRGSIRAEVYESVPLYCCGQVGRNRKGDRRREEEKSLMKKAMELRASLLQYLLTDCPVKPGRASEFLLIPPWRPQEVEKTARAALRWPQGLCST